MNETLIGAVAAAALGLLSFFEPCTIATHTLYAARVHARRPAGHRELLALWLTRSALSAGLLLLAVALTAPPRLGGYLPSIVLAVMASVYLVSRFVYLPVPHLEAWKLVPGGAVLSPGVKLGLTLPACTLPLFVIIALLSAARDSLPAAAVAGILFATLFTAPTAIAATLGVSETGRHFLHRAALATPYLTAALLYGAAAYLLV